VEVNASLINFAAGQLSKKFLARVDLPNFYKAGTLTCRNFIPQAQGPAEFRPGFQYIHHTRLNGHTVLFPFVFNDDQSYALAFSDQKLRFFSDGGLIFEDAGTDQYQFLSHFDGSDGATSYDAESGQTLTFAGDAQLDTAQKKFGTASLLLDGTGDYVTAPKSADFLFGTDVFTVEAWVRPAAIGSSMIVLATYGASSAGWSLDITTTGKVQFTADGGSSKTSSGTVSAGAWAHIAYVRWGLGADQAGIFIDGVLDTTFTDSRNYTNNYTLTLGNETYSGKRYPFNGHIDEPAILKGTAKWTSTFVPPTAAYASTGSKPITGITQADPGVITVGSHGYSDGDEIYISGVGGMTELNNNYYLVTYINTNTFSLTDIDGNAIDTTTYTAFTSGGTCQKIYEVDTPYEEADLYELQFAQKADLMYITHPNYEPRKLIRSGEASWTLSTFTRTDDPFTKTISGISQADPGVVTATAHGFENGDIIEINGVVGMTEVNENTYKVANKAANNFELTDPETGADVDTSGFTAYSSGGVVFKEGNMPGAVAFYGGRLFYGGTDDDPETFWGSKAPDNDGTVNYDVFTVGASEEDAVVFPIASQNNVADRIQWFSGTSRFLAIGTFGGVYKANGGSDATPISGTDIAVQALEFIGCKYRVPVRVGSSIFYIQRGGRILNKFGFSLLADEYKAENLNIFSDEITDSGLLQLAVQQGVADIIWSVVEDGRLLGLTVKTAEEISAWHEHHLGGTDVKILSVCGEPQPDNQDSLWAVVERTINGNTRRYTEYLAAEELLPEEQDYYTGDEDTDDDTYRRILYEEAKQLIRLDSSLTLDNLQTVPVTPGALTGTGVSFTATGAVFSASDVGRYIVKKTVTGTEKGRALITAYVSDTEVTCTITEDFDSTDEIEENGWYLTVTEITGLDHLEGETVSAQVDGADDGDFTVTSGAITLNTAGTVVHVGLPYTGRLQTMPLDIGALAGTAQARITTVNRLGLLFRHSRGTKYGTDIYRLETLQNRDLGAVSGRPAKLLTAAKFLEVPDGYDRRKYVYVVQDSPNPCAVQGIVPYVDTTNE